MPGDPSLPCCAQSLQGNAEISSVGTKFKRKSLRLMCNMENPAEKHHSWDLRSVQQKYPSATQRLRITANHWDKAIWDETSNVICQGPCEPRERKFRQILKVWLQDKVQTWKQRAWQDCQSMLTSKENSTLSNSSRYGIVVHCSPCTTSRERLMLPSLHHREWIVGNAVPGQKQRKVLY